MLARRTAIDDRNNQPNATATFADLYQTSQNPVFGWFSSYGANLQGAWKLTLTSGHDAGVEVPTSRRARAGIDT